MQDPARSGQGRSAGTGRASLVEGALSSPAGKDQAAPLVIVPEDLQARQGSWRAWRESGERNKGKRIPPVL